MYNAFLTWHIPQERKVSYISRDIARFSLIHFSFWIRSSFFDSRLTYTFLSQRVRVCTDSFHQFASADNLLILSSYKRSHPLTPTTVGATVTPRTIHKTTSKVAAAATSKSPSYVYIRVHIYTIIHIFNRGYPVIYLYTPISRILQRFQLTNLTLFHLFNFHFHHQLLPTTHSISPFEVTSSATELALYPHFLRVHSMNSFQS